MLLQRNSVGPRELVILVHLRPVHGVARRLDGSPLALVFRSELVPIVEKVRPQIVRGRDVADVLARGSAVSTGRTTARSRPAAPTHAAVSAAATAAVCAAAACCAARSARA